MTHDEDIIPLEPEPEPSAQRFPPVPPPRPDPADRPPPPYSFGTSFGIGSETFKAWYGQFLLMSLIVLGTEFIFSMLTDAIESAAIAANRNNAIVFIVMSAGIDILFNIFVGIPFTVGVMYMGAKAARGQTVGIGDGLIGFTGGYFQVVACGVVAGLAAWLVMVPVGVVGVVSFVQMGNTITNQMIVMLVVLGVLSALLAIYIYVRLWFAGVLCVDPEVERMTIGEALGQSWAYTKPHGVSLTCLVIAIGLLAGLTLLLCIVGILFLGYPYYIAVVGAAYHLVVAPHISKDICGNCGYSLVGLPADTGLCPECGEPVSVRVNPEWQQGGGPSGGPVIPGLR